MKRRLEKRRVMKYYDEILIKVKAFTDANLAKKFVIKRGCFEGETVTVAGYTTQDGMGVPSIIVELPDTLPMNNRGWSPEDKQGLYDHILLDADPTQSYWYVDIKDLEDVE